MKMKIIKMLWHDSEQTNMCAMDGSCGRFDLKLNDLLVGTLSYKDKIWSFIYSNDFKKQDAYAPLTNFPIRDKEYKSEQLWPFFASRLPGISQLKEMSDNKIDIVVLLRKYASHVISNPYTLISLD